jgi:hypothetical protein
MGKHTRTVAAVGSVAALGAALFAFAVVGADAKGGTSGGGGGGGGGGVDAKQNALQAASCVDQDGAPATVNVALGYNRSGDRVTLAVIGSNGDAGDVWMVGLFDNGALLNTFAASTSDWTVIDTEVMAKGDHTVSVLAGNQAGVQCSASASFKI